MGRECVNDARIEWHQQFDDSRFHPRGVIAIDDVLIDKTGKFIKDGTNRGYVGDLKFNRKPTYKGVERQAVGFAKTIPPSDRKPVAVDGVKQWHLSVCVKMPNIDHKVRVVILWRYKNDAEPRKILVTNKIHWNAERIIET